MGLYKVQNGISFILVKLDVELVGMFTLNE